jgi:hypothetical protein
MEIVEHGSNDMPKPTRHPMAFHRRTYGLADDEPNVRTLAFVAIVAPPNVNDDIGLHRAYSVLHRGVKLR